MKVCYLNFDGAPTIEAAACNRIGGLNVILFNLLKYASSLPRLNLSVLYRYDGLNIPDGLSGMPITVKWIIAGKPHLLSRNDLGACLDEFTSGVKVYLRDNRPDLVHTSGSESGYAMIKLRQLGIRIPWVHTNYATLTVRRVVVEGKTPTQALVDSTGQRELSCLQSCDHIIALSEIDRREISAIFGVPPTKITVAEPGVNHEIFYPRNLSCRQSIVVSAGRMSRVKDFPFLVRCFRQVVSLNPELEGLRLVIVGGNEKERAEVGLPQIIESLDLESMIEFVNGMDQRSLAEHFCHAKVFAGASKHETFGLLPVEARACGTPFVVRANSSYLTTATDGFGGYFADNNSERDMAIKISHILNLSQSDWAEMSRQAFESAKRFQWTRTVAIGLNVYQPLLESFGSAP